MVFPSISGDPSVPGAAGGGIPLWPPAFVTLSPQIIPIRNPEAPIFVIDVFIPSLDDGQLPVGLEIVLGAAENVLLGDELFLPEQLPDMHVACGIDGAG